MKKIMYAVIFLFLFISPAYAVDITWGSATTIDASACLLNDAKTISSDKFVACWSDNPAGKCVVATVSGTTPTLGSQAQFNADIIVAGVNDVMGVSPIDTDQFAVFYTSDANADDGYTQAANVSGTTITFGSGGQVEFETGDTEEGFGAGVLSADKSVFTYNDETNSNTCTTVVCTNDGTPDQTCGTPLECDGSGATDYYPLDIDTIEIGTDKWVSCWRASDDTNDGYCAVGTASGTTITYDVAPNEFADASTLSNVGVCSPYEYGGTADRFVVVYDDSGETEAMAGTVSTRTITFGTANTAIDSTSDADHHRCAFVSETKFVVVWEDVTNTDGTTRLMTVDWSTRAITAADAGEEDFETNQIGTSGNHSSPDIIVLSGFDGSTPKVAIVYNLDTTGGVCASDCLATIIGDLSLAAPSTITQVITVQ